MIEETEKITTGNTKEVPLLNKSKKGKSGISSPKKPILRTMKSDMQEYINRQKMSLVDIAGKQAKKSGLKIQATYSNWPNMIITIVVIIFIILSAGVLGYTVIRNKKSQINKEISQQALPTPIVIPNEQKIIHLNTQDKNEVGNIIREVIQTDTPIGSLTNFIFVDENNVMLNSDQLLKAASVNAPLGFSTFLTGNFMFGIYSLERNEPFIILKVRSYENTFALMLKWEKTMKDDLRALLPNKDTSGDSVFQDRIIKNNDTRILYGQNGEINILYSFLDKKTLVITSSTSSFEEILGRLSSSRF